LNVLNSIAIAHIHTKFGTEIKTDIPKTEKPSNFTSEKIPCGDSYYPQLINCSQQRVTVNVYESRKIAI